MSLQSILDNLIPEAAERVKEIINSIFGPMKNQSLTDDAVKDVAKELVTKNGKTTTLEIKNELRKKGYHAIQDDVSAIMDSVYMYIGMQFTVAGGHREYTYSNNTTSTTSNSSSNLGGLAVSTLGVKTTGYNSPGVAKSALPKKAKYSYKDAVKKLVKDAVKNDWCVKAAKGHHDDIYYAGDVPNYAVRYAYYKETGVLYKNTRARRVRG